MEIRTVNMRSFGQMVRHRKKILRKFLNRLGKQQPRGHDQLAVKVEIDVWKEIDCLSCANCCKKMSPTYSPKDITRIAAHLDMSTGAFKKKWLYKDREGDWLNKSLPCQFLNMETNKCSIYEVRPADCAGFPHLSKKKMVDYIHIHKQNIEYCPATHRMVEKMISHYEW